MKSDSHNERKIFLIHLHLTSLVIAAALFFITYYSIKKPGEPDIKYNIAVHMIARLLYVVVLVTGAIMFYQFSIAGGGDAMMYGFKMLAGLITIGLMEMAVVRQKKKAAGQPLMITFIAFLVITVVLGVILPAGPLSAMF